MSDVDRVDLPRALDRRRRDLEADWNLTSQAVVIGAGTPISMPGRGDLTYPFRAHSEYLYLTDRERPGGVLAYDPADGWVDFVVPVSRDERLWEGASEGEPEGRPIAELETWLQRRSAAPIANLGQPLEGLGSDAALTSELRATLNRVRRQKDAVELDRMRTAERATRAGFAAIAPRLVAGATEREVQIELESAFLRAGADRLAFDTIVGGGPNSAVLHFPPSSRALRDGELVLIDAGGESRGYDSDVTRTYPVSGRFAPEQAELHALVRTANLEATQHCVAGTEFTEVHLTAARVIAGGLVELGLLRGDPDALVARGTVSLFFPHGVGHMVGLGVRDAGEILAGRTPDPQVFPGLRIDLPLLPGYVVTIEPGVYFVPALLRDPELRARHRDAVDWDRAERMLGFGGIRIEDNVLVTTDGFEVLTADVPLLATDG
jgi:Xaa-Pro aminopeptidase